MSRNIIWPQYMFETNTIHIHGTHIPQEISNFYTNLRLKRKGKWYLVPCRSQSVNDPNLLEMAIQEVYKAQLFWKPHTYIDSWGLKQDYLDRDQRSEAERLNITIT